MEKRQCGKRGEVTSSDIHSFVIVRETWRIVGRRKGSQAAIIVLTQLGNLENYRCSSEEMGKVRMLL